MQQFSVYSPEQQLVVCSPSHQQSVVYSPNQQQRMYGFCRQGNKKGHLGEEEKKEE